MDVNRYQFDHIVSKTKKMISPIIRGQEESMYFESLALLEIQLYDFHERYGIKGRQAKEIMQLILFDIKGKIDHEDYICSKWEEACYRGCADVMEQFFFPDKNSVLKSLLVDSLIENQEYFEFAQKHIIRIHESIEMWTKDFGTDGYFNFIGKYIKGEIRTAKKYLVEDKYFK